ncbi:MAG TPA: DUF4407 domain-containing protein [Hanamia sp.]|jgi:Domain of unknown function (DUF4407)|nr:DUF4407 domain-containing protein [Hanamia sp.]
MKNWWIRFGCFLTGYNYGIVRNSSEVAAKAVKRYTSAMLIVCIIWAFIGYVFTDRYLHGGKWGSVAGSIILVVIIIQIERQIILSINPTVWLYVARGIIAAMMAIIGAIIIDQIIFKEDIELEKITSIEERVKKALPPKTEELKTQIRALDSAINQKENERLVLISDVEKKPTTTVFSTQSSMKSEKRTIIDSITGKPVITERSSPQMVTVSTNVPNPQIALIAPLEKTIADLRIQKSSKDSMLLNIRPQLEKEISSKVGFLDELEVMYSLISRSKVALIVWLIWFFFLFGLEMLVLISKVNEKENDYEKTVKHHMALQMRKLEAFAKAAEGS